MNVGQAIINLRKEKQIRQEKLALEAGISRHFWKRRKFNIESLITAKNRKDDKF